MKLTRYVEIQNERYSEKLKGCDIVRAHEFVDIEKEVNKALMELQKCGAKIVTVGRPYAKGQGLLVPIVYDGDSSIPTKIKYLHEAMEAERVEKLETERKEAIKNRPSTREMLELMREDDHEGSDGNE